jgi:hypothetical protein
MKRWKVNKWLLVLTVLTLLVASWTTVYGDQSSLVFNPNICTSETLTVYSQTIKYRACLGIVYVSNPVDTSGTPPSGNPPLPPLPNYQVMNFYYPEEYDEGGSIYGYTAETAPIFFQMTVGGYNPGAPANITRPSVRQALLRGYVVAAPGARGRTNDDTSGLNTGKAPACIVDVKAAVRYLRYNDKIMPGDAEKIITNGTSASGALSSLLGATGNNKDYEPYLKKIGAAKARDDVFAASCYCPITNLDNADMAYEWLFSGVWDWKFGGVPPGSGTMNADQIAASNELKAMFPDYLNSLGLKAYVEPRNTTHTKAYRHIKQRLSLTLDANGEGTFKEYVKSFVIASAQKALDSNKIKATDPQLSWITFDQGIVTDIKLFGTNSFADYDTDPTKYGKRMKPTNPAFDALNLSSWENSLFGNATIDARHFTQFSYDNNTAASNSLAEPKIVKMLSPMDYIGAPGTTTARYWRIRHGSLDKDTSIPIPIILATRLQNNGASVDFAIPWGVPHGGDYDLDELFAWIDRIAAGSVKSFMKSRIDTKEERR